MASAIDSSTSHRRVRGHAATVMSTPTHRTRQKSREKSRDFWHRSSVTTITTEFQRSSVEAPISLPAPRPMSLGGAPRRAPERVLHSGR